MLRKAILIVLSTVAVATAAVWLIPALMGTFFVFEVVRIQGAYQVPRLRATVMVDYWNPNGFRLQQRDPYLQIQYRFAHADLDTPLPVRAPMAVLSSVSVVYLDLAGLKCSKCRTTFPSNSGTARVEASEIWIRIHLAYLLLAFGAYPLIALIRGPLNRRQRRRRAGQCVKCGYDLTGLTEPRCPECGKPFEKM